MKAQSVGASKRTIKQLRKKLDKANEDTRNAEALTDYLAETMNQVSQVRRAQRLEIRALNRDAA